MDTDATANSAPETGQGRGEPVAGRAYDRRHDHASDGQCSDEAIEERRSASVTAGDQGGWSDGGDEREEHVGRVPDQRRREIRVVEEGCKRLPHGDDRHRRGHTHPPEEQVCAHDPGVALLVEPGARDEVQQCRRDARDQHGCDHGEEEVHLLVGGDLILRHRTRKDSERQDLRHLREQGSECQACRVARQARARWWVAVSGRGGSWHVQRGRAHSALAEPSCEFAR